MVAQKGPVTPKRIPLRMCAVCRQQYPKHEMIRLTKTADGRVALDETGKMPGRGYYICHAEECLAKALKGARLEKTVGAKIDEAVILELKEKAGHGP